MVSGSRADSTGWPGSPKAKMRGFLGVRGSLLPKGPGCLVFGMEEMSHCQQEPLPRCVTLGEAPH